MNPSLLRVLRLLQLAESDNPSEARSARRRAREVMQSSGLTFLEVEEARRRERIRSANSATLPPLREAWQIRAALSVGSACGVAVEVSSGGAFFRGPGAVAARDGVLEVMQRVEAWMADQGGREGLAQRVRPQQQTWVMSSNAASTGTVTLSISGFGGLIPPRPVDGLLLMIVDTCAQMIAADRPQGVEAPPPEPPPPEPPPGPSSSTMDEPRASPEDTARAMQEAQQWAARMQEELQQAEMSARMLLADPSKVAVAQQAVATAGLVVERVKKDLRDLEPAATVPNAAAFLLPCSAGP